MNGKQAPIGSGFGAHTTADEVLAGLNLSGKRAIVTGGHSGLGLETTRALAGAGAKVTIGARSIEAARSAVAGIDGVEIDRLDLSDLESVRVFAERLVASGRSIDVLINSAGIMACPETRVGDGWEAQFATNHLGHFALVNRLWPAISRGARIVSVSSGGHHNSAIRWEDVQFETGYDKWRAYGQSKTANALFAVHLDRLGRDTGIRAFSLHPGKILTPCSAISQRRKWSVPAGSMQTAIRLIRHSRHQPRGRRRRFGRRPRHNSTVWEASIARTAISPSAQRMENPAASATMQPIPRRRHACGSCRQG